MQDSAIELQLFQSRVQVLTFPVIGFKSISYALYLPICTCALASLRLQTRETFFLKKIDVQTVVFASDKVITQEIQGKIDAGCYKIEVFRMMMANLFPDKAPNVGWVAHLQTLTTSHHHHPWLCPQDEEGQKNCSILI